MSEPPFLGMGLRLAMPFEEEAAPVASNMRRRHHNHHQHIQTSDSVPRSPCRSTSANWFLSAGLDVSWPASLGLEWQKTFYIYGGFFGFRCELAYISCLESQKTFYGYEVGPRFMTIRLPGSGSPRR
jgi:hypothetical protein